MMPDPTCDRLAPDLSAYVDGELAPEPSADLEAHLARCGACRADLEALAHLGAELAGHFAELQAGPAVAESAPPARPRLLPLLVRPLATAAALLALLLATNLLLDGRGATRDAALVELARDLADDLARPGQLLLVSNHPPEAGGQPDELAHHLVAGPDGAYLWQLARAETALGVDPERYLLGSDGQQLWTWDPVASEARTLPVGSVPTPLPGTLARLLEALPLALERGPAVVRERGAWTEVTVETPDLEAHGARLLVGSEGQLVGLEALPRADLALFLRPVASPPAPTRFGLASHAPVAADAVLALELPEREQPDALWSLGYTPGAPPRTWPEALGALAAELGALGYL
jgi:hypothetical protein